MTLRRALVATALSIAGLDLLQLAFVDFENKAPGAIGGAAIYGLVAWGAARDRTVACWIAALMPVIPLSVLGARAVGLPIPMTPDAAMIGILGLQLLASALGIARLRADDGPLVP